MSDYWLARLGRNKFARYFPTGVVFSISVGYYAYHTILTNLVKEFFGYYNKSGAKDTISENLRKIIGEVYLETREKELLTREYFESNFSKPANITWFASSSLEPVTFGMTELKSGAVIGLPYFYNFNSPDDIPDEALELKKVKLFRNPLKKSKESSDMDSVRDEISSALGDQKSGIKYKLIKKFDRDSILGKEYMDTLILSPDAKKFSIARELFLADSYRVLVVNTLIFAGGMLALGTARFSVLYFKVFNSHMSARIPYYGLSAIYGYGLCTISLNEANKHYYIKARDRAKNLGENYVKGAEEYFAKCKLRRDLLAAREPDDGDY